MLPGSSTTPRHALGLRCEGRTVSAPDVRSNLAPATVVHTSSVTACLSAGLPLSRDMLSVSVYLQTLKHREPSAYRGRTDGSCCVMMLGTMQIKFLRGLW